jgi:amino acid adenylation domain-containing protein
VLNLAALRQSVEFLTSQYQARHGEASDLGETSDASGDSLQIQDYQSLPIYARESEARVYIHQHALRALDLKAGALLYTTLVRLSEDENILLISMHRSLCRSGVLTSTLVAELSAQYNGRVDKQSSALSEPMERQLVVAGRGAQADDGSWNGGRMRDRTEPLPLRADAPRSTSTGAVVGRESHMLSRTLRAAVREFSAAESVPEFITLFAAFAALLSRHSGQQQFVAGASTSNLALPAEYAPSAVPALLPLQADLSGDPSFRELLQRIRRSSLQAFSQTPAFSANDAGIPARRSGDAHSPLNFIQVGLMLEESDWEALRFSGFGVSSHDLDTGSTGLDLLLHLEERSAGLWMTAEYDAALFNPATMQRFLGHYEALLAGAISSPEGSVSRLPILSETELLLLNEWNRAAVREYPSHLPLQRLIEDQVDRTPDAVAVVFGAASSSRQQLTYAELNARANRLASHLRSLGVTTNTLVGVCLERSIDLLIAPLAILKAGGAYLPLDPDHPDGHLAPIVQDARLGILIGRPELATRLPEFGGKLVVLDWEALEQYPDTNHPVAVSDHDLAYVIYTSGSTGQPKGVMIPRRALTNVLFSVRDWFHFGPRDVLLALTTIAFDIAGIDVWLPLLVGARMLMVERAAALDERMLEDLINREGVTFLQCTPATWKLLLDSGWQGKADLQAVCTGEAMPKDLARELVCRVGAAWNMYGPTETTIWSTGFKFSGPDDPILIGRPIANTQAYILDEHLAPTPIGVPGELYLGGDGLATGYLHNPALTAARFVADPFSPQAGARLYKTGDVARYHSDGNIECLGRNDDQIKLRGYRIEPGEICAAILRHPSIRDAVAVLQTGATGDSRIVAYLISKTGEQPEADQLRGFLRLKLPEYMIPASFAFLDSFPLNTNGKLDRRALPKPKTTSTGAGGAGPADPIEELLSGIFRTVLGLREVGVNDDFFDLGGHSLTAAHLFREINICFNLNLPLATLFHAPTVRRLANLIRDAEDQQMSAPVVKIQPNGSRPPMYCIGEVSGEVIVFRRLAQELGQDQPMYGLQPFRLLGPRPTVQQLAAAYIRELRERDDPQPFCLLGYSFGGLVAVEMARQLQLSGVTPPVVVLIDAAYPAGCHQNESWSQKIQRYRYHWRELAKGGGLAHILSRMRHGAARLAHRATTTVGVSLTANGVRDVGDLQGIASDIYRIKSYNGRVHLFRAESQIEFLGGGEDLGWAGVLSNLVVEAVPGDHGTINTGTNLKILARKLKQCLYSSANGRSAGA